MGFDLTQSQEVMAGLSDEVDAATDDDSCGIEAEGDLNRFFDGAGGSGWDSGGFGGCEEIGYLGGARGVDRGQNDVVEDGKEDLGHLAEGLIAKTGEDEALAPPGLRSETWGTRIGLTSLPGSQIGWFGCAQGGAEGPRSGGIMGYVENDLGLSGQGDFFEAAGPVGVSDASLDG